MALIFVLGAVPAPGAIHLGFTARSLVLPAGLLIEEIAVQCSGIVFAPDALRCDSAQARVGASPFGAIRVTGRYEWHPGPTGHRFSSEPFALLGGTVSLTVTSGHAGLRLAASFDGVDLVALIAAVAPWWSPGEGQEVTSGTASGTVDCTLAGPARDCHLGIDLQHLDADGANVAEDAHLAGDFRIVDQDGSRSLELSATLVAGAIYVEPGFAVGAVVPGFLLRVADAPVEAAVTLARRGEEPWQVESFRASHPGVGSAEFSGRLAFSPAPTWERLRFSLASPDLAALYATYVQPLLLGSAGGDLEVTGAVTIALAGTADEIDDVALEFSGVYLDEARERFSLYGLDGSLRSHSGAEPIASTVSWAGAGIYSIELGPGRVDFRSSGGEVEVVDWADLSVFDGSFDIDHLQMRGLGSRGFSLATGGRLEGVSMAAVSAALGWPALAGSLSGSIPTIRYQSGRLELDGTIAIDVFGGRIAIESLEATDLFTRVPIVRSAIAVQGIDLAQLTEKFSFGNIEGHLDGAVRGLELQAWQPVAFDAFFATPSDDDIRHRISRKAVDNLGRLGTGAASGLNQGWLSLVPSYSYGRLGIGCRLLNGYCEMRGVAEADDGQYFILTRGGLLPPWIAIKGTGRRIAWSALTEGLKEIATRDAKVSFGATAAP